MLDSVDDGWGLPVEPAGSLICSVPSAAASQALAPDLEDTDLEARDLHANVVDAGELDAGWNLAEGTFESEISEFTKAQGVMPLGFRPAPLASEQVLSVEEQEEFSKPDLALGTDVDLPPPAGLWFGELAPIVAREAPRPARRTTQPIAQAVNIKSCFSAAEDSFFATGDEIDQASALAAAQLGDDEQTETPPGKRRWWHWRR